MKKVILLLVVLAVNSSLQAQMPPAPVLGFGENWTNLWSVSYDYQTNGSIRYIVQDPSNPNNLCAISPSEVKDIFIIHTVMTAEKPGLQML